MQHTNVPNKSAWNPISRNGIEPSGFVSVSAYQTPYMRAAKWNPDDGATAIYDTANTYQFDDVSTRKQGGWIAAVPRNTNGIVLYPFDKDTGFGSKVVVLETHGPFVAVRFSSDGNYLACCTSTDLHIYNFNSAGIGSEIQNLPALRVSSIYKLAHSYELDTFMVCGTSNPCIELRTFNDLDDQGIVNNTSLGLGFPKLSGIQASGKRYWALSVVNSSLCYYGQIDNRTTLTSDGYINTNTNRNYPSWCPMFVDEGNAIYLGQSTDSRSDDYANGGHDYLGYVIPANGGNLTGPSYNGHTISSMGSAFTARWTNGGDGGGVIATLRPPGLDVGISGLNYGWNNTRAIDCSIITASGFGASKSTFSTGVGVRELDWF